MKIAYLDCFSGVSGNMMLGALIDAGVGRQKLRTMVGQVVGGFTLSAKTAESARLGGVHVRVGYKSQDQPERHLRDIERLIDKSSLAAPIKQKSKQVFEALARAEGKVHRQDKNHVHFHEVGAVDAIVDVVGSVCGFYLLGVERVVCSPLPLAGGEVNCAHGALPLPAPAVMELLKGAPIRGVPGTGELVTPTGAALAVTLSSSFGPLPPMKVCEVGVGIGDRVLPGRPNIMRLLVGETAGEGEALVQLEAGIDDMSPEKYDLLLDRLHRAGALEVMFVPAQMKKNRPGVLARVLVAPQSRASVVRTLLDNSTTLGVREWDVYRAALARTMKSVSTPYGKVGVKTAQRPDGSFRHHLEYDDLKAAAVKNDVSIDRVEQAVMLALWGSESCGSS